ncbi:MAG: tetratricopeptide repeat protein [Bacteroidia bacterium]
MIFEIKNGKASKVTQKEFKSELELHDFIDNNLEELFEVRFIKKEHRTDKHGRIETLGLDYNNRPVVVEYKKTMEKGQLVQAHRYIDWIEKNKAEFELLVRDELNIKVNIDFANTRIICFAQEYNMDDKYLAPKLRAELWKYTYYENDTLSMIRESEELEQFNTPKKTKTILFTKEIVKSEEKITERKSPIDKESKNNSKEAHRNYYVSGHAKIKLKDYAGAIEDYTKAIELKPNDAKSYSKRADAKNQLEDYRGAIKDYTKAFELNDCNSYPLLQNAEIKFEIQDYKGAIQDYTRFIQDFGDDWLCYNQRGLAKYELEDYKGSIQDFTVAIKLLPEDFEAYENRGLAKHELEDYKGAIEDYTKAIKILNEQGMEEEHYLYTDRGNVKIDIEDYKGAIEDYTKAIKLDTEDEEAYHNRGCAKYELEDFRGAIDDFTKAIKLDTEDEEAYYKRGLAKYELKDKEGAFIDWKKAFELGYIDAKEELEKYCK